MLHKLLIVFQSTYGFCNTACPGGVYVGPSDVGGICPPGVETVNKTGVDHCCCGSSSCCWASCTDTVLPMDCLPPGAEWTYNNNGYYVAVQAAPSNPASTTTSLMSMICLKCTSTRMLKTNCSTWIPQPRIHQAALQ